MQKVSNINIFNRYSQQQETEKVYGAAQVKFLYQDPVGKFLSPLIANRRFSQMYGHLQSTKFSARKIPAFIKQYDIDLALYKGGSLAADKVNSYASFNEFFIRQFEPGARNFVSEQQMAAPCEARYFAYEKMSESMMMPIKGAHLSASGLLGSEGVEWINTFKDGPAYIARLCPVDYHRYHYPDDGETLLSYTVTGNFDSVNPWAIAGKQDILLKNERRIAILETKNFGKLAYIEVGAVCVGKIVQSANEMNPFQRGDEKGYFLFGGSTVVVLGEAGKWRPSSDLLEKTKAGVETYVHLGDEIAVKEN